MVNFPAGKERSFHFPVLAVAIRCEDECTFARPDEYSNSAHLLLPRVVPNLLMSIASRHKPEALRRSCPSLERFRFAVPWRGGGDQRLQQMLGNVGDLVDRVIECFFVSLRGLGEAADLPNKLKRGRTDFVIRRGRQKIMQSFDVSAH